MSEISKTSGLIAVLAKRMVEERLPKALALKERVDRGESLNELDLKFLEQVIADAGAMRPLIKNDPKIAGIAGRMMQLYTEISGKALENEKANQSK